MAIEFSLSELELRRRQNTLVAKSISTDGTEGNLIRNFQVENTSVEMFSAISDEANETVSHFLRCWSNKDNIIYARDNIDREEKEEIVKRIGEIADGVFQFSDIHEHGGFLQRREDLKWSAVELRRSQSTGCLDDKSDHESEFPIIDSDHHVDYWEESEDHLEKSVGSRQTKE